MRSDSTPPVGDDQKLRVRQQGVLGHGVCPHRQAKFAQSTKHQARPPLHIRASNHNGRRGDYDEPKRGGAGGALVTVTKLGVVVACVLIATGVPHSSWLRSLVYPFEHAQST